VPECRFCKKLARLYYVTTHGLKVWYCAEHYDRMAAYYREHQWDNSFSREMVKLNGW